MLFYFFWKYQKLAYSGLISHPVVHRYNIFLTITSVTKKAKSQWINSQSDLQEHDNDGAVYPLCVGFLFPVIVLM